MTAALQIYYTAFDATFFTLPPAVQARIEGKIDEVGLRLRSFPHHRLTGVNRFRLRVGDYRVIYTFDVEQNVVHLLGVGSPEGNLSRRCFLIRGIYADSTLIGLARMSED